MNKQIEQLKADIIEGLDLLGQYEYPEIKKVLQDIDDHVQKITIRAIDPDLDSTDDHPSPQDVYGASQLGMK